MAFDPNVGNPFQEAGVVPVNLAQGLHRGGGEDGPDDTGVEQYCDPTAKVTLEVYNRAC